MCKARSQQILSARCPVERKLVRGRNYHKSSSHHVYKLSKRGIVFCAYHMIRLLVTAPAQVVPAQLGFMPVSRPGKGTMRCEHGDTTHAAFVWKATTAANASCTRPRRKKVNPCISNAFAQYNLLSDEWKALHGVQAAVVA